LIRKLRLKFILVNMSIVTVMLLLILGLQYRFTAMSMQSESERMLRAMAMTPREPGRPDRWENDERMRLPFFTIKTDSDGNVLEAQGGYYDLSDEEMLRELYVLVMESETDMGTIEEYSLKYMRNESPMGMVIAFADVSSEKAAMKSMMQGSVGIGIAAFLGFLVISILLARWAVKPVEQAFTRQKEFISDASHELKTPLTIIMTNADMLSSDTYNAVQKEGFLRNIQTMAEQMRGLVESLLTLTRVDNGTATLQMSSVDLSTLVEEALLPFEPVFFEKGLSLTSELEKGIALKADEGKLRQVVEILLDNAQKYCSPETETKVRLVRQHNACLLSVANTGEPLTKEEQRDIFKRFYRADKARSMNHSYGLGLSIALSIVETHKGKIWVESNGGVNTFYVQLPLLQK